MAHSERLTEKSLMKELCTEAWAGSREWGSTPGYQRLEAITTPGPEGAEGGSSFRSSESPRCRRGRPAEAAVFCGGRQGEEEEGGRA